ncbi:MAG: hypothetical protein AB7P23_03330 [Amphiplicatus sp.]
MLLTSRFYWRFWGLFVYTQRFHGTAIREVLGLAGSPNFHAVVGDEGAAPSNAARLRQRHPKSPRGEVLE